MPAFNPPLSIDEIKLAFADTYQVDASLQTGGQGAVFKARAGNKIVALKVYHADQLEERLAREIEALKSINGQTLVELHDAGTCHIRGEKFNFLATAFIDGVPLDKTISTIGQLPLSQVAQIGSDVAIALSQIWAARIVHRDIKPNNVMIAKSGRAVLIDLGIARHVDMTSLTTTGKTWGTPGYMSPEQARGRPLTCKSDIFALGILLQECILGRHPSTWRQEHLLAGGPMTSGLRQDLPEALITLIDSMVHHSAIRRPMPDRVVADLAEYI